MTAKNPSRNMKLSYPLGVAQHPPPQSMNALHGAKQNRFLSLSKQSGQNSQFQDNYLKKPELLSLLSQLYAKELRQKSSLKETSFWIETSNQGLNENERKYQ